MYFKKNMFRFKNMKALIICKVCIFIDFECLCYIFLKIFRAHGIYKFASSSFDPGVKDGFKVKNIL